MLRLIAAALVLASVASPAVAQVDVLFFPALWAAKAERVSGSWHRPSRARVSRGGYGKVIGRKPAGCPRAYCGCASARYVGLSGRQWWLAANWLRLPRAAPAPGMAAARRGHVRIIVAVLGNGRYRFYDPNSGGGLTRITTGTLAGYTVVNPRGRSFASAR